MEEVVAHIKMVLVSHVSLITLNMTIGPHS